MLFVIRVFQLFCGTTILGDNFLFFNALFSLFIVLDNSMTDVAYQSHLFTKEKK